MPAPRTVRNAFSLIELLVVLAIIVVLAGMLLPAVRLVRDQARSLRCQSDLRQLALGSRVYADDWDGRLIALADAANHPWMELVRPYVEDWTATPTTHGVIWGCPVYAENPVVVSTGALHSWFPGYALNGLAWEDGDGAAPQWLWHNKLSGISGSMANFRDCPLAQVAIQSQRALFADAVDWWPVYGGTALTDRHRGRGNLVCFDLHVESAALADLRRAVGDPRGR